MGWYSSKSYLNPYVIDDMRNQRERERKCLEILQVLQVQVSAKIDGLIWGT